EKDMLKEWANGRLQYARLSKVRGQIIFQGISKIAPNDTIKLDKMGDYFNGEAYVSAVRHEIREGNWITEVEVGMDDSFRDGEANQASASELLPSIQGLYVAIVKQIADDPDGNYRILVDIPLLKESGEGIWARYATGYATSKAGLFFMPEQQDEVIVGFINGDPRFPIVLGSLYSKKHESPEKPEDKNDTKAIITREQLKVTFDEKKKEIIIETPKKNKVTFSDDDGSITLEDQNRNTIKMSSSGIEIDSCKDIKLSANANIEIKAMGNIKESATGNYEVSGLTVKANAQAQLSLKGQISEISGAGVLTVKGGIVRIN
ncbi:MAG: phage baseplate assembly protein V, partial [Saprospiraceae bacterium]